MCVYGCTKDTSWCSVPKVSSGSNKPRTRNYTLLEYGIVLASFTFCSAEAIFTSSILYVKKKKLGMNFLSFFFFKFLNMKYLTSFYQSGCLY